jgi:hypothetical protein
MSSPLAPNCPAHFRSARSAERRGLHGEIRSSAPFPKQAHALLGRPLVALDDPDAERPLAEAAGLFRAMGYRHGLAEAESLTAGPKL